MHIDLPDFSAVLLVGPSGSGKSTFAAKHFGPTEVLSSDHFRALVSNVEDNPDATADAFAVLREVLTRRLARRLLTVVDATNLRPEDRAQLIADAQASHAPVIALAFDVSERSCLDRNAARANPRPPVSVKRHCALMRKTLGALRREGFSHVYKLGERDLSDATIDRVPLWTDRRADRGPFDIIGDVHGCLAELLALLKLLGYTVIENVGVNDETEYEIRHPEGRRLVFLGDLADRGPDSVAVFNLVMDAVEDGVALCVIGNHDFKLWRHLRGRDVSMTHGFAETAEHMGRMPEAFRRRVKDFIDRTVSHYVLDGGALAVAHAGVKEGMQARGSRLVKDFCMFGEATGEIDEFGLPVRHDWAADYKGAAAVVYGHTPVVEAEWVGNTLCIDTGCVFGGKLTALRWPEKEIVAVPAERVYYEPIRPLAPAVPAPAPSLSRLPDAQTLLAKTHVETRYGRPVLVQAEQAVAAFEALARYGADPRWLAFVPPTTATVEASTADGWLERPEEGFAHYARAGVATTIVQKKHMGSRAVAVVCRDAAAAARRFHDGSRTGAVLSKSGRPFFDDPAAEAHVLGGVRAAMEGAGLWDTLATDWVMLDGEMLPWSVKAGALIRDTFAATGAAGAESARAVGAALARAATRGIDGAADLAARAERAAANMAAYRGAYGAYCQPYTGLADLRFAPFHVLAAEGRVFATEGHDWHMGVADALASAAPGLIEPTPWRAVDPASAEQVAAAAAWWEEITADGHEGFIIKGPGLAPGAKGLAPSIKVRGREYLRIIYGANYLDPEILPGLKNRATGKKRLMARIGMALGLEGLARLTEGASLARVHEAVWAALAVASEPIDIRL